MNLSRISMAINQLCKDLTPPPGAVPPTPRGGFPPLIGWAEVHPEKWRLLQEQRELVHQACGVFPPTLRMRGPVEDHLEARRRTWLREGALTQPGWWVQIGGRPFLLPDTINLEAVQECFRHATRMHEADARVWFDEADEIDPIKWERIDPSQLYIHPSHTGAPGCRCPDCRILR